MGFDKSNIGENTNSSNAALASIRTNMAFSSGRSARYTEVERTSWPFDGDRLAKLKAGIVPATQSEMPTYQPTWQAN